MDRSDIPLAAGALVGVIAYVVGYLLTYVWQAGNVRDALSGFNALVQLLGGQRIPVWTVVGWLFYDAHFVPIRVPMPGQGAAMNSLIGGNGATQALYVLPPVVLLVAGAFAAYWAGAESGEAGLAAGVSIATAYFVLAVLGAFVFQYSFQGFTISVDLLRAVVIAGIVYPVAFGAIGGAAYGLTRS